MGKRSIGFLVLTGGWVGLLTGFGEIVLLGLKKYVLGQFIRFGPEVIWLAPLMDGVLFAGAAALLAAVPRRVAYWSLAFLAFLSFFLMYYPLHPYAKMLLAAGLAVQAVRSIERWPEGFQRLIGRTAPWMAALVLLGAIGVGSWRWIAFKRTVAGLPAASAGAPNVLLIVADTARAENLSLYGYHRPTTPNLERWAASSVVFDEALAPASWTLPSHASMFTGRLPHELSTNWEAPLDARFPTLAEILATRGYVTSGFVANTYYCGYELGLSRGFAHYEDYVVSARELIVSSSLARSVLNASAVRRALKYYDNIPRKNAAAVNDHFLKWVGTVHDRPFFAFLNYFDAHETYLPPEPFKERFGPDLPRGNEHLSQELRRSLRDDWKKRPPEQIQTEVDMYDGALAYIDAQLDHLLTELRGRGLLENTLVIVTSDHGEQFGEHGLFLHANSLYQPVIHVPLMVRLPSRVPQGRRIAAPVSLRDLPATVLDLSGIRASTTFPGASLARYWSSDQPAAPVEPVLAEVGYAEWAKTWFPWYPTAKGDMQSLSDGHYHYIRSGDGREELYALDDDPAEQRDVSGLPANRERLQRFRAELRRLLESS